MVHTPALKGVANGGEGALADKQRALLRPQWGYGWSAECPGTGFGTPETGEDFVPMTWGRKVDAALKVIQTELPKTNATHLLGFNEPDLAKSSYKDQANMSVAEAVKLWPKLEDTELRLGSPSTISHNAEWLKDFMIKAKAKGLRVDFMTMHCYGWPNVEDFLRKVRELSERYDRPVWVTEFAVADFKAKSKKANRWSIEEVEDFMRGAVAGLREMEQVERFAWKTRDVNDAKMWSSALFQDNGELTSRGRLYASL